MGTIIVGATVYLNVRRKLTHYEVCWIRAVANVSIPPTPPEANWHGTCKDQVNYMTEISCKIHARFPGIKIAFVRD